MSKIFALMFAGALVFGAINGRLAEVSTALPQGAAQGVQLIISIAGAICVWQGVMEVMDKSGLSKKVAALLSPIIRIVFNVYAKDTEARSAISQNMSANLLGLGSAATPAGIHAARRLGEISGAANSDAVLRLIILNTASMQLIPTNVAAVRAAAGAENPFVILPAVWLASAASVFAAVMAAKLFSSGGQKWRP